ncbi:hypothetical protein [Methanoplanus limicola]|uniref:DUF4435 domain-containing protein n=1 Tax=Methanoplanus limicola DSM 2279 TaxID=937775 RepID=H1YYN1_9EURY|nr:hypothetical protein [Methanoplanus limicola]EHQ36014.1 hypothetical protein Metlim_1920 [Methanoplanus limicola DSM 2279]
MTGKIIFPDPKEAITDAKHILFVEGDSKNSIDPKVLRLLLGNNINVLPLGPSAHIRSAAKSLYRYHPSYYFLIDRDHFTDEEVEECWGKYPDPDRDNLLIWRLRELENYFLNPSFLGKSRFCKISEEELEEEVLKIVRKRLYMETANHVIIRIREDFKKNWIKIFTNPNDFTDRKDTVDLLTTTLHSGNYTKKVWNALSKREIESLFEYYHDKITQGSENISFDNPKWLKYVKGKKILSGIIGSPSFFEVRDRAGNKIEKKAKLDFIIRDLLLDDNIVKPGDFTELKKLIEKRIQIPLR